MNHDVIVIGGSAGSLEVLFGLAAELPADLPASIFIALHTSPGSVSPLPELLSRRGPLPATHPLHEEPIRPGRIYVAPPDNHLLVRQGRMEVTRGPKENNHRPAVDALFRTAASAYGPRVIGVVLSGYQDCGTAGMMSIRARGGLSVVQRPDTAQAPDMPRSVVAHMPVDHVVEPSELASLLARLAASPSGPPREPERAIAQLEGSQHGGPADIVCPTCTGVLTETAINDFHIFRCHVGHAFSVETLLKEQGDQLERALWSAVRALEESAALNRRMADGDAAGLRGRFARAAGTYAQQAKIIRDILLHHTPHPPGT